MQTTTWAYNKGLQWKLQQAPAKEPFRGGTSQVIVSFLHLEDRVVLHQRQKKKVPLLTSCIDSSHQGPSQEQSSQIIQPMHTSMQLPPFVQISSYGHQSQIHLAVSMSGSSSMALPALSLPGSPLPPLGLHTMHPSSSLGESSLGLSTQTNPYLVMRGPKPPHYRPSRPSAYLIPMPHLVDCSGTMSSGMPSLPTAHGEEQQREYWWSSLEVRLIFGIPVLGMFFCDPNCHILSLSLKGL